ncbi:serine hydrolase domain-containing protein [Colwelliaceae bacterium 6441]
MKKNSLLKIALFVLTFFCCLHANARDRAPKPKNLEELKQSVAEVIKRYNIPAVAIAMVDKNGPVWVGALGKSNLENNTNADENTLFRIASTSKMFVSLSILKLVEQGQLKLTDRLSDLAPEIAFENQWEKTNPIKLVHLLEHTTGWDEQHYPEFAHNDPTPISLRQGLNFHPHSRSARWVPGTRFAYNNSGPSVAAYIVEKLTKRNFEDYVEEHFFKPIGMPSTTFYMNEDFLSRGAKGYGNDNNALEYKHLLMRPSGSINSTATDMAKFLQFYLNRGSANNQQILSPSSISRMEQVKSTGASVTGQQTGYGLNNYSSAHGSWVYREHNGGMEGAQSEFAYLPEANLGHVILINSKNVSAFQKLSKLIRDYETRGLAKKVVKNEGEVTLEYREIEGLYYPLNPRVQKFDFLFYITGMKTLSFEGDTLVLGKALGTSKNYFYPVSLSSYRSELTGLISLSKVIDPLEGEVIHLAYKNGAANNFVLKRVNSLFGYLQLVIAISWILVIISSFVYFIIWFIRRLAGKIPSGASIRVRVWPFLASTSVLLIGLLLLVASTNPYQYMPRPTPVSVGIALMTVVFACVSLMSVITVYKARRLVMNRFNYWYSTFSSVVHFLIALHLLYFGVIGIMFWE